MMDVNSKYRRWGWGAIIGLVLVILISGFVVAVTLNSSPKPNEGEVITAQEEGDGVVVGDTSDEEGGEEASGSEGAGRDDNAGGNAGSTGNTDSSAENGTGNAGADNSGADGAANSGETKGGEMVANMPETGPEDVLPSFVLIAIAGMLIAYNWQLKRGA